MKKTLQSFAASAALFFAVFLLAGFAPQDDAAKDMETFSRAILKEDAAELKRFGCDREAIRQAELESMRKEAVILGRSFPEDLLLRLSDVSFEAAGKCEPRVKVLAGGVAKRTLEISFEAIDYRELDIKKVLEGVWRSGDLEFKRRETMEDYTNRMVAAVRELEPSDTKKILVDCVYDGEKGVWLPENPAVFIHELLNLASGGGTEGDPAKDIEDFSRACLRQDLRILERLGIGDAPAAAELHEAFVQALARKLKKDFPVALTERQAFRLAEASMQAAGRAGVKARTLCREGEFAEVELTVESSDPFPKKEMAEVRKRVPPDASMKEVTAIFVDEMVSRLEQAQPSSTKTIQVTCVYYSPRRVWVPRDAEKFLKELFAAPLAHQEKK